ncbi:hypothetical protein ACQ1Q5_00235 [Ornithobacterium rhinotracheale]
MKKLFYLSSFIFFALNSSMVRAQEEFRDQMKHVFEHVKANDVPTGYLLDFGLETIDLSLFNGKLTNENFTNSMVVGKVNSTISSSQLPNKRPKRALVYKDPYAPVLMQKWEEKVDNQINNESIDGNITIAGVLFEYNKFINDEEEAKKYIDIRNDQIYIKDKTKAFEQKRVFVMSPSIHLSDYLDFNIEFNNELLESNLDIKSIELNANDGKGFINLPLHGNKVIKITYPKKGDYEWIYKATLSNGDILFSHSKFRVNDNERPILLEKGMKVQSDKTYYRTFLGLPAVNKKGGYTLEYKFSKNNPYHDGSFVKPLIVVEGFDPIISGNSKNGGTNLKSFLSSSYEKNKKEALESLLGSSSNKNVRDGEYDIIYINWRNPFDYIQSNALLLEQIIQDVAEKTKTNEKSVILGQSMGGVIARYALKDMEDKKVDHNTKLFISQDAPHQGANIPLSLQAMYRHINEMRKKSPLLDLTGIYRRMFLMLDEPSVKQMLQNRLDKNYNLSNEDYIKWDSELKEMGYPQLCRNVAMSNASRFGEMLTPGPHDAVLYFEETKKSTLVDILNAALFFANPLLGYAPAKITGGVIYAITGDVSASILAILPGRNKLEIVFKAFYAKNNYRGVLYQGRITYHKKILWLIKSRKTLTSREYVQPYNFQPKDLHSGGFYPLDGVNKMGVQDFSFISRSSSLDMKNTYEEDAYKKPFNVIEDLCKTPFDNVYLEHYNSGHTKFSIGSTQFLSEELEGSINKTNYTICNKINGGGQIFNPQKIFFGNGDLPPATSIKWKVSNNLKIVKENSGSVVIEAKNKLTRSNTNAKLIAEITHKGVTTIVEKELKVGAIPNEEDIKIESIGYLDPETNERYFCSDDKNYAKLGWIGDSNLKPNSYQWGDLERFEIEGDKDSKYEDNVFEFTPKYNMDYEFRDKNTILDLPLAVKASNGFGESNWLYIPDIKIKRCHLGPYENDKDYDITGDPKGLFPPSLDVDKCPSVEVMKNKRTVIKKIRGARFVYFDVVSAPIKSAINYFWYNQDKIYERGYKEFPGGYFEYKPIEGYLFMKPDIYDKETGELHYKGSPYSGFLEWGRAWFRFVHGCKSTSWSLIDFSKIYTTNAYSYDKDFNPWGVYNVSPNPITSSTNSININKNIEEKNNHISFRSANTTASTRDYRFDKIEIVNMSGIKIFYKNITPTENYKLEIPNNLSNGLYILNIYYKNKLQQSTKIIIQK